MHDELRRQNTKAVWRLIAKTIELAFVDALGIDDAIAKKSMGHGIPKEFIENDRFGAATLEDDLAARAQCMTRQCRQVADKLRRFAGGLVQRRGGVLNPTRRRELLQLDTT